MKRTIKTIQPSCSNETVWSRGRGGSPEEGRETVVGKICERWVLSRKWKNARVVDGKSQIPLRYLIRSWSQTSSKLVGDQLRTSFEPASVMECGFKSGESTEGEDAIGAGRSESEIHVYFYRRSVNEYEESGWTLAPLSGAAIQTIPWKWNKN